MTYTMKKVGTLLFTLFLVSAFTFFVFQVIPGDSVLAALGMDATEEAIQQYRQELGLDQNLVIRYIRWLGNALQGDFGSSMQYKMPVSNLVSGRLPATIWLALLSFLLIVVIGIPLGLLASKKRNGFLDHIVQVVSQIGMAVPPFFLGMIITMVFGVFLKWFVPGSYQNPGEDPIHFLRFMIFPATAIAIPKIAMLIKFLRSSIDRQMELDYVRTARSKGMKEHAILNRHVFKNALIPVITFMGMILADILAGTILIEQVFNIPGLGRLLVVAISNRDYTVVQAIVLYIATMVVLINFIVDILYQWIDPRVNVSREIV